MSLNSSVADLGFHFDADAAHLGWAMDRFLGTLSQPPALLGLGEPTHGREEFPLLRNQMLAVLVEQHGYRSIAIESDCLSAATVNDYVTTGAGDLDNVLDTGFSHGFGALPANRDLVTWLRAHNARNAESRPVRFYGFDAPTEMGGVSSPRASLLIAHAYLAAHLPGDRLPHDAETLDDLLGDDATWESSAAMLDPAESIGNTPRARTLRLAADDLVTLFETEAPGLRAATSDAEYEYAAMCARTAHGLLRYHAAMATPGPDRVAIMLRLRDAMMAANLAAIAITEANRGPCLVFAQNAHLQRHQIRWNLADMDLRWWSAGANTASALKDRYAFIAADHSGHVRRPERNEAAGAGTPQAERSLQAVLTEATPERALFPTNPLAAVLAQHPDLRAETDPEDPGYFPIEPGPLGGADAVAFISSAPATAGQA